MSREFAAGKKARAGVPGFPAGEHLEGGLTAGLVLVPLLALGQRHHRLPQTVLLPASAR